MGDTLGEFTSKLLQNGAIAIGDGDVLNISGRGSIELQVWGTFVGTIVPEVYVGDTWHTIQMFNITSGSDITSITTTGGYVSVAAGNMFRARISAYTSGEIYASGVAKDFTLAVASNVGSGGGGGGGDVNLIEVGGAAITLGQKANAASIPVTLSTEQDDFIPTIGAVADAAVTTDTTGTISGKLRGLVKWAYERMPASLGQKAPAASFPVVLSTDDQLYLSEITLTSLLAMQPTVAKFEPTLSVAPAYSIGDAVGADFEVTIDNGSNASFLNAYQGHVLKSVTVVSKSEATLDLRLLFFDGNVTYADNAAVAISDADAELIRGIVSVLSTDYIVIGGVSIATISNLDIVLKRGSGFTGYCVVVANQSFTAASTTDLQFVFGFGGT